MIFNANIVQIESNGDASSDGLLAFSGDTIEEAVENAFLVARLKSPKALIGATGRVVYPDGPSAEPLIGWVFTASSAQS